MPEGTIDGKPYSIALGNEGQTLWETVRVAEERDEVWEDWSLGMGETEKETGRGYYFSEGFDASLRGILKLSPNYINDNNTNLTRGYGYFLEAEGAAATLTLDATSNGKASVGSGSPNITVSHTVAAQDDRLLFVFVHMNTSGSNDIGAVTYAGSECSFIGFKHDTTNDIKVAAFYILNPPTGANNIVVHFPVTADAVVAGLSFYNANQDTPFDTVRTNSGSSTSPTVTTDSDANDEAVGAFTNDDTRTHTFGAANETERWDTAQNTTSAGGGEEDPAGASVAPTLSGAGSPNWVAIGFNVKPANTLFVFCGDATKIFKYQYDGDTLTLIATKTVGSGVAGQPVKANGSHYFPMGSGANAQKLTDVDTPTWSNVTGTWKADHLTFFQKGVTPTVVRVNSTTQHQIDFNEDTGDLTDTWSGGQSAGDSSTKITHLVESQGQLYVCKEDNLYEFGVEAESRPTIPFFSRGKADSDAGKGSFAFGDTIVYMGDQLWRYRIGGGALPVGLDSLRGFRNVATSTITPPLDGKPRFGVTAGEYWYVLQNEGERSLLLQMRQRREGDPAGHEMIIHGVLELPLCKGLFVDSKNNLWLKGASAAQDDRDIRVIKLNKDGSSEAEKRKGQANSTAVITLDERDWGRPFETKQFRAFYIETSGDWDATTSLALYFYRDDNDAEAIGSAITSATVTINNWTVGTTDTGYRGRPELRITLNSSYAPITSDPSTLRLKVTARFPEIIRIIVLGADITGTTAIDIEQNLRRLQNQGVITFRRPDTISTFSGEITSVADTMYATKTGFAHGIELQVRRWVTS